MPIFYQHGVDDHTRLAIWKIEEEESFFRVPLQRSITHPHKRLQHLAGRYLLRFLFPEFPLELIKIADTRKPFLEDEAFHFSISHCGDYAAAMVSRDKRVGIDVEAPTPKVERIRQKFLHAEEMDMRNWQLAKGKGQRANGKGQMAKGKKEEAEAEAEERLVAMTLLWSCKESVFKWWSYGNVDFSEMIRLIPSNISAAGIVYAQFKTSEKSTPLAIQYRLFPELCLAWVC